MSSVPDRLYIENKDKRLYDALLDKDSPLARKNGFDNKDIFLLAMNIGLEQGVQLELKKRLGYFHVKNLSNEELAILYAIAVDKHGLEVIKDLKTVYQIAEEYANGGIRSLYDDVFSADFGSFEKRLEKELRELAKQAKTG